MADPVSLTMMAIGGLSGVAASGALSSPQGQQVQQQATAAPPPDPSTPASSPGQKPGAKKSQQQSFLSGAAGLQRDAVQGTGSSGGKSLLGQ